MTATAALHAVRSDATNVFGRYPTHDQRRAWLLEFAEAVDTERGSNLQPHTDMIPLLVPIAAAANCRDVAGCFEALLEAVAERSLFDGDPGTWLERHGCAQSDRDVARAHEITLRDIDLALDALMGAQS